MGLIAQSGHAVRILGDPGEMVAVDTVSHECILEDQGPHVVTGPIEVRGVSVGDVVSVYVHDLAMRAAYGTSA